jgi:stage V sporulation protein SpoVS
MEWLEMDDMSAQIKIPLQGTGGDVSIKFTFKDSLGENNLKAGFTGSELTSQSGVEAQFTTNLAQGETEVSINLSAAVWRSVQITEVDIVESGTASSVENLRSLQYTDLKAGAVATWSLNVMEGGSLLSSQSSINGVDLVCFGTCTLNQTTMQSFEPIDLSDSGIITLIDSNLNGSITDEDIKSHPGSEINWDATTAGSGGNTDRWTIEIVGQNITSPLPGVLIQLAELGYWNVSKTITTDANGMYTLPSRIIQWMDSSGEVHSESPRIVNISFIKASTWGDFTGPLGLLGSDDITLSLDLPMISVLSVDIDDDSDANIGDSVSVTAKVKNDGAAATIALTCTDSNGIDVSTMPTFIPVEAGAQSTTTVQFKWVYYSSGEESITCSPLIPPSLEGFEDLVLTEQSSANSSSMKWIAPVDSGANIAIWLMVAVIVGIGALLTFTKKGGEVEGESAEPSPETEETEDSETTESDEEVVEEDS